MERRAILTRARLRGAAAGMTALVLLVPEQGWAATAHAPGDPFEGLNRALFAVNQTLDKAVFRPLAMTYVRIFPKPLRQGLHHATVNLSEPEVALNDVLQGRIVPAAQALTRFAANSTFGLFGLFDVAGKSGLPHHSNDFGLTLARHGVKSGPFLFVPLLGPTTVRDGFGGLVNLGLNPLNYSRYPGDAAVGGVTVVSEGLYRRAQADPDLKALQASATDVYASLRSFYLQNREGEVSGGKIDLNALPDFDQGVAPVGPAAVPAPGAAAAASQDQTAPAAPPPAAGPDGEAPEAPGSGAPAQPLLPATPPPAAPPTAPSPAPDAGLAGEGAAP